MNSEENLEPLGQSLEENLQILAVMVRSLAEHHRSSSSHLLSLLRTLESLHQDIRENLFQDSLPDNRQALYALLRDIEATGGWPYIHRMRLQSFLEKLQISSDADITSFLAETLKISQEKE